MFAAAPSLRKVTAIAGLSIASILSLGGIAQAQTSGTTTSAATRTRPAPLTTEQETCMASKGVTKPDKPAAGSSTAPRTPPTAEQLAARAAAATACGVTLPPGGGRGGPGGHGGPGGPGGDRPQLTDTQKACLTTNGVTLPTKPAADATGTVGTGMRPARVEPTAEQKATMDKAAAACGIALPTKGLKTATATA